MFVGMLFAASGLVGAADVEFSTTCLTSIDNGGGYIEYHLYGNAASELRTMIDDPSVRFPYETAFSDGDGTIDMSEGDRYMGNLDDIFTKRYQVLRGVKLDNVDVDEARGVVGTHPNDTKELYLHITFRSHIQYDSKEFNVSGLEPLAALYGNYTSIPPNLTVEEKTTIVAAGLANYERIVKEEGTLFNLRLPGAAVVSYSVSYTVSDPPAVRMEYDHSDIVGNPLPLGIMMFIFTWLALRIPKATARENEMERFRPFHLGMIAFVLLVWIFYFFGGPAVFIWVFCIGGLVITYYLSHRIYKQGWMGWAEPVEGKDLGEIMSPTTPEVDAPVWTKPLEDNDTDKGDLTIDLTGPQVSAPAGTGQSPVEDFLGQQVTLGNPSTNSAQPAPQPAAPPPVVQPPAPQVNAAAPPVVQPAVPQVNAAAPPVVQPPSPQVKATGPPVVPPPPPQVHVVEAPMQPVVKKVLVTPSEAQQAATAPPATPPPNGGVVGANNRPLPRPPSPVSMRCPECASTFQIPGSPRPLAIVCPSCGRKGMVQ
jgi:hypothetical protein